MRIIILLFTITILTIDLNAQKDYYWYKGEKIFLDKIENKKYLLLESLTDTTQLKNEMPTARIIKYDQTNLSGNLQLYNKTTLKNRNWLVIENSEDFDEKNLKEENKIIYTSDFYFTSEQIEAGLSHLFYVKLKNEEDLHLLEEMAKENKVDIIGQNKFMPLWFTLSCSRNSKGDALEMANAFYESTRFAAAEPDLMTNDVPLCTNDTHFNDQWGLNNTGQNGGTSGVDINFCHSRQVTIGDQNITVAVLDHGFEMDHPDLANVHPQSFDTESGTSPANVLGNHGTACAGIIGATSEVTGIAPNCPLMSISNSFLPNPNSRQTRADGINFAWQNGAAVISNSWISGVQHQIIDDAIENALDHGRNGLGTVVVFATGNDNSNVSYPANSNFDIIAVGALSPCGERKSPGSCDGENNWGSNYSVSGNSLDIMAPGVIIPTTDRQGSNGYTQDDFVLDFKGTSSACPHVAGVSALILSVNSGLTQHEVGDIIANTAQKVGGYNYQPSGIGGRGTWHNEVGHGLVDAHHAVQSAVCDYPIENTTYTSDVTIDGCAEVELNNVSVENGANLIIENIDNFEVTGPFSIETGSQFTVNP